MMAALPPAWDVFRATVEGRESSASCVLVDGQPVLSFDPIPPGAPPKPQMLADLLRSGQPVPDIILEWMADMLDPAGTSVCRLRIERRGRGRPVRPVDADWSAVAYFDDLMATTHQKEALYLTCQTFSLSESTLRAAIARHARAVEEDARVTREESPGK